MHVKVVKVRTILSATLSVIGVIRRRRRKRFRRPGVRCDRQQVASNETGSENRSVIAAIDSSTTCSYSTSVGYRGSIGDRLGPRKLLPVAWKPKVLIFAVR